MKTAHIFCAVTALAFLAGCGVQDTATHPPLATLTVPSLVNAPSSTPSPTDQPTQTATLTPIPTLSEQDAHEAFVNLIEKDGECDLPCWLGVTPGQTGFEEVANIFSQFSMIGATSFTPEWALIRVFFPNFETSLHETSTEVAPAGNGKVSRILVHAAAYLKDRNGPRDYNSPEFQELWKRYFLPGILTKYGSPEKVFLDTMLLADDPAPSNPFVLWIVYPQQGFLMLYTGSNSKVGDDIRICPLQSEIQIKIWDTEEFSYEEFVRDDEALPIPFRHGPQPIESVTDFSIESFYQKFRSGEVDTCFETPASIWTH